MCILQSLCNRPTEFSADEDHKIKWPSMKAVLCDICKRRGAHQKGLPRNDATSTSYKKTTIILFSKILGKKNLG